MSTEPIKYLSLFSGIGGFEYGLEQSDYDFECIGFSEVDSFAKSIYTRWFPRHRDLGDASKIDPKQLQDFDLLVGGFPCQAFSLSGKRKGFDDTRGTMFFEIARICAEKKPRYLLLENVKGLLSHDGGRTYKKMLGILSELGYDVEWEIYNSKSFGTAQNRERLYIKGYFRAKCGREILSVPRSDRKINLSESKTKVVLDGKQATRVLSTDGVSVTLCGSAGGQGGKTGLYAVPPKLKPVKFNRQVKKRVHDVDYEELSHFLKSAKKTAKVTINNIAEKLDKPRSEVEHWFRTDKFFAPPTDDIWFDLKHLLGITDDKYDAFITEYEWVDGVYEMDKRAYDESGLAPTLTSTETLAKINVVANTSPSGHYGGDVYGDDGISRTLTATNWKHPLKVAETLKLKTNTKKGYDEVTEGDGVRICHPTSTKARGRTQKGQTGALSTQSDWGTIDKDYRIRRLTPRECERLQAFPDDWTRYGADGKEISDTQRYKCLGNAVTTSVVTWIMNNAFFGEESEG